MPAPPGNFESKATPKRDKVATDVAADKKPSFDDDFWKAFKAEFSAAQHGKCGYCEAKTIGTQFGDVEHYRPKSAVELLPDDESKWGVEKDHLSNVSGRRPDVFSDRGYHWLAYSWENYLLSCAICNQQWKKAIFPVEDDPRTNPPDATAGETALVLYPFGDIDPGEHLEFTDLGEVAPRNGSLLGLETIKTCGLNRPSLQGHRIEKAQRTLRRVNELADLEGAELDRVLSDIAEEGDEKFVHCGMVRILFEQNSGMSWEDLETIVG